MNHIKYRTAAHNLMHWLIDLPEQLETEIVIAEDWADLKANWRIIRRAVKEVLDKK